MYPKLNRGAGAIAGLILAGALVQAQAAPPVEDHPLVVHVTRGSVTVRAHDESVRDVLEEVARQGGILVDLESPLDERTTLEFDALPLSAALVRILQHRNFALRGSTGASDALPAKLWVLSTTGRQAHHPTGNGPAAAEADQSLDRLLLSLKDGDAGVRREAVFGLSFLDADAAMQMLEQALTDPDRRVRDAAVEVAGKRGREGAARLLAIALDDEDADLREEVVYALGDIGGEAAAGALQEALADESSSVREAAAEVLADLTARR